MTQGPAAGPAPSAGAGETSPKGGVNIPPLHAPQGCDAAQPGRGGSADRRLAPRALPPSDPGPWPHATVRPPCGHPSKCFSPGWAHPEGRTRVCLGPGLALEAPERDPVELGLVWDRLARNNWLRPRALCSRGQGWLGRQPLPRRAPLDLPSLSGRLASVCLSRHGCVIPCSSCVRKAGALWGRLPEVWPLGHGAPHGVEDPLSSEPPGGPRSLQGCCSVRVRGCLMRSGGLLLGASAAAG